MVGTVGIIVVVFPNNLKIILIAYTCEGNSADTEENVFFL